VALLFSSLVLVQVAQLFSEVGQAVDSYSSFFNFLIFIAFSNTCPRLDTLMVGPVIILNI